MPDAPAKPDGPLPEPAGEDVAPAAGPDVQQRRLDDRRNARLGIASGIFATLGQDFMHPELILSGMVYALTGSAWLVALINIIDKAGALAPQLWVGTKLEHQPRKRPYFVLVTVIRGLGGALMVACLAGMVHQPSSLLLLGFMLAFTIESLSSSAAGVIFLDLVGRMIPKGRLGSFFGARQFLGGLISTFVSIFFTQQILTAFGVPLNYLILVLMGAVLMVLDMSLICLCKEQPGPTPTEQSTLGQSLRRGMEWMRQSRDYRLFFLMRVAFRINYLGLAFFIPYGTDKFRGGDAFAMAALGGVMVGVMKFSRVITSATWGSLVDRHGHRPCLVVSGMLFFLAPALALLAPLLPPAFCINLPHMPCGLDLRLLMYLLALAAIGAAMQGNLIGNHRFLITTAPPGRRISYVGFMNTITSPLTLLPLAGAWLASSIGMTALFLVVLAGGLLAMIASMAMSAEGGAK